MTTANTLAGQLAQCCSRYQALGVPAAPRDQFVEIRTNDDVSVLLLPDTIGPVVAEQTTGPVIGPVCPARWWRFLVVPDHGGVNQLLEHAADILRATLCYDGAVLILPTTLDHRERDGCEWFRSPATEHPVPQLSDLLKTALGIADRAGRRR